MTDVADRRWRLIRDEPRPGPVQMALEEVAIEAACERNLRTVRVYDWQRSTLSLGYRQDPETVDWDYCDRHGICVTRRQTGGGGIYHDRYGDISYTIVSPTEEVPGDLMDCYALFCDPILEGLSQLGVEGQFASEPQEAIYEPSCYLRDVHPAHDVVVPGEDGERKLSGNAQYRRCDAVIQHGSITYERVSDHHVGVFATDEISPDRFGRRVTSVSEEAEVDRETAVDVLADALGAWCDAEVGEWTADELERAHELAERKYGADGWIRERTDPSVDEPASGEADPSHS